MPAILEVLGFLQVFQMDWGQRTADLVNKPDTQIDSSLLLYILTSKLHWTKLTSLVVVRFTREFLMFVCLIRLHSLTVAVSVAVAVAVAVADLWPVLWSSR